MTDERPNHWHADQHVAARRRAIRAMQSRAGVARLGWPDALGAWCAIFASAVALVAALIGAAYVMGAALDALTALL